MSTCHKYTSANRIYTTELPSITCWLLSSVLLYNASSCASLRDEYQHSVFSHLTQQIHRSVSASSQQFLAETIYFPIPNAIPIPNGNNDLQRSWLELKQLHTKYYILLVTYDALHQISLSTNAASFTRESMTQLNSSHINQSGSHTLS